MVIDKDIIENLKSLAKKDPDKALISIRKIIKNYPYLMSAKLLELQILKKTNNKGFKNALSNCAIQTSYRNILYKYLENTNEKVENYKKIDTLNKKTSYSFLQWLELIDTESKNPIPTKFDRIDNSIENNSKIKNIKSFDSENSLEIDNGFSKSEIMTETLAHLYWKQKKYKEAKKAFKILSLKYPEKSSLFANHLKKIKQEKTK
jgi:hypothetical protein